MGVHIEDRSDVVLRNYLPIWPVTPGSCGRYAFLRDRSDYALSTSLILYLFLPGARWGCSFPRSPSHESRSFITCTEVFATANVLSRMVVYASIILYG